MTRAPLFRIALEQANGTDRGDAIVSAMIEHLRDKRVLLPAIATMEKIALAARAIARKRAHKIWPKDCIQIGSPRWRRCLR